MKTTLEAAAEYGQLTRKNAERILAEHCLTWMRPMLTWVTVHWMPSNFVSGWGIDREIHDRLSHRYFSLSVRCCSVCRSCRR